MTSTSSRGRSTGCSSRSTDARGAGTTSGGGSFFDHLDDHNAWRVVQRVKALYPVGAGAAGPTAGEYPNASKSSA